MRKLLGLALAGAVSLAAGQAHAAGELFFYNWTDYTGDKMLEKFQKDTGIKVTVDTYDSNETLLAWDASVEAALRSGALVFAISSTCDGVTLPTFSLLGSPEPLASPAAWRSRTAAGGVLVMKE